jgi:3-hydroxyacyl-[acyl-carrier-protein] dehydratase
MGDSTTSDGSEGGSGGATGDLTAKATMDIHQILAKLPHRYPFLLVDRVLEFEKNRRIKALKNVSINEPFFVGHFPIRPVMPGVLILEAMAQAAGLLSFASLTTEEGKSVLYYLAGIDGARFKRPVEPGDALVLDVVLDRARAGIYRFNARATVGADLVSQAQIMCTIREVG